MDDEREPETRNDTSRSRCALVHGAPGSTFLRRSVRSPSPSGLPVTDLGHEALLGEVGDSVCDICAFTESQCWTTRARPQVRHACSRTMSE